MNSIKLTEKHLNDNKLFAHIYFTECSVTVTNPVITANNSIYLTHQCKVTFPTKLQQKSVIWSYRCVSCAI